MSAKPECRACKEDFFDEKFVSDLLYSIFNPYHRDTGKFDVQEFLKSKIKDRELLENFDVFSAIFNDMVKTFGYAESLWMDKFEEYKEARKEVWEEIKEMLSQGKLSVDDISISELVDNLYEEILRDLIEMGYVEGVIKKIHRKKVVFSSVAEGMIGEKVLAKAVEDMEEKGIGEHEEEKPGLSPFPGYEITDYDAMMHTFDMIDLQETLIKIAKKNFELEESDIVVRKPKKSGKRNYVMLIDTSDSMRGRKIIGAIEAALALKRAIRKGSMDELITIAFNHRAERIREGDLPNLDAKGRTDIGLALRNARRELRGCDGRGIVFLITDGEPTSSYNPYLSPWRCALMEAKKLRDVDAYLHILMLGRNARFLELCQMMVKEAGKGSIFYFSDPLRLKNYVYRRYQRHH